MNNDGVDHLGEIGSGPALVSHPGLQILIGQASSHRVKAEHLTRLIAGRSELWKVASMCSIGVISARIEPKTYGSSSVDHVPGNDDFIADSGGQISGNLGTSAGQ
jgi:hypothetical protein